MESNTLQVCQIRLQATIIPQNPMITRIFPILAVSIFSCMLGSGIVVPLLPLYAQSLGASAFWLGVVFASFPISRILTTPVFGRLSDHKGRKLFIAIGLIAYGIISFGFVWVNNIFQLASLRFLHGIAGAMILPIAQAYVGDISPSGEEGKWMGYANAAFMGGFGFGPLMGGVITDHFGIDIAFYTMGSLSLLAFTTVVFFLPESKPKHSASSYPSFKAIAQSRMVNGLLTSRLGLSMGRTIFFTFMPILVASILDFRPSLVGILLTVHILLISLLGIPLGRIADRFNRRFLVICGFLLSIIFLVAVPSANNFGTLLILAVLGSLGSAIALPASSALAVEEGRKYGMGSTMALFNIAQGIGMVVGPLLGGAIADFANINSAFHFGAIMTFLGIGLFTWLSK